DLPNWRRSGFWTTNLRDLRLDALAPKHASPGSQAPAVVAAALGDERLAGKLVQLGASVIEVELAPELADQGVILCSLEDAARTRLRRTGAARRRLRAVPGGQRSLPRRAPPGLGRGRRVRPFDTLHARRPRRPLHLDPDSPRRSRHAAAHRARNRRAGVGHAP